MLATLPVPILSVTADAVRELQGQDALCGLWTIFTKCKESVQDGRRLENISWRLWYRELVQAQLAYQPLTPDSTKSHPKDERPLASFFPADANERVSPEFQVLSSGLPSPSDQASPSPLPTPMPTMVPPPTPERPRISPHSPGSNPVPLSSSFTRGKSTPCVGRLIVDMLPNHVCIPQRKVPPASNVSQVPSTPLSATKASDPQVPLVQLPSTPTEKPFPRVVVVNPTPHPTPPMTPILHDDLPGAPQPPSSFLLPPLPPPALRHTSPQPSVQQEAEQQSQLPHQLMPKEPSPPQHSARATDVGSSARLSDRRFFLQHSPEDASPERGDGSTASGKSPSDLFEAGSAASSKAKSVLTDVDVEEDDKDDKDDKEDQEEEDEEDRRSTVTGTGGRHGHGRAKPKRGKEVGKARPMMRRSHSAKHVAPSMLRKLSTQQAQPQAHPHPQHHRQLSQDRERGEKKAAMFNFGSGSSNGSRSATGSSGTGAAAPPRRGSPAITGLTVIQTTKSSSPLQTHPPVIPNGFANGHVAAGVNPVPNANANANANTNANTQSRKTIVVANTSSEEYETTDGEDSEEWASEDMDAEDKAREAEETRLREAAVEAQRQRDLFAKIPKRSYSNLNRTQSGLLSQLMNPNPAIFPANHSYRSSRSSTELSRQYHPVPNTQVQRSSSAFAPPRLSTSKSAAALPMAAQITAISSSKPPPSSGMRRPENEKNGYRPKGPPQEQEMEDDSGDDADDRIQVSQSVAQQRLQALMSRRSSEQGTASHLIQPAAMDSGPGLLSSTSTLPIPLGYPYNLPAPTPPMTPRTTRRRMLKMELSESMRRQLLWERQVSSNTNSALVARRASQGPLGGLRPLTPALNGEDSKDTSSTRSADGQDKDERKRRGLKRNPTWADDYHYSGW